MLRSFGKSLVVTLACAASGCSSSCCYDFVDETMTGFHDHFEAKMAWHACRSCFTEVEYIHDFKEGFMAGYIHVMNGGGCCRPTLPPRKYWSICTRGPENNCRVVAWYNGWSSGVAQAHSDGMGTSALLTGPDIYHTNQQVPVALPDDFVQEVLAEEESGLEYDVRQLPMDQGILPADQGAGGEFLPPAQQLPEYNPGAVPENTFAPPEVRPAVPAQPILPQQVLPPQPPEAQPGTTSIPAAALPPEWRRVAANTSLLPPPPPRGE